MVFNWTKLEVKEGDLANVEDESIHVDHWSQNYDDDEDAVIDLQLKFSLDGGTPEGSDEDDLYVEP